MTNFEYGTQYAEEQRKANKRSDARIRRALRLYGRDACIKAYRANEEGWGPSSIMFSVDCGFKFKTVGQVDAAINAGRWYDSDATNTALREIAERNEVR